MDTGQDSPVAFEPNKSPIGTAALHLFLPYAAECVRTMHRTSVAAEN